MTEGKRYWLQVFYEIFDPAADQLDLSICLNYDVNKHCFNPPLVSFSDPTPTRGKGSGVL